MIAVILGAVLFCALVFFLTVRRGRLERVSFALALAVFGAAVAVAAFGAGHGLVYARYASDPGETVNEFFSDLEAGQYDAAYALLGNYSDLGLGREPDDPVTAQLSAALRESYAGRLIGEPEIAGLSARQTVELTALDVSAMQAQIRERVLGHLAQIVDSRPYEEVYDEQDQYRPEITEEAYGLAVEELLAAREDFARTETLSVALSYDEGGWHILADSALLSALNGYITQ